MYLLYLDASGTPDSTQELYYVLGGVAVYERRIHWLTQALNRIAASHLPEGTKPVELHASAIRNRQAEWASLPRTQRESLMRDVYGVVRDEAYPGLVLFAAAIHKPSLQPDEEPLCRAFEEVCRRFDLFLHRRRSEEDDTQRGLVVLDACRVREKETLRKLWTEYYEGGTRWGRLANLTDIPLFADSRATRMLQLADFCCYAVYRRYERGDTAFLDAILSRFDQSDGRIHGLVHHYRDYRQCWCPACSSRRT